MEQNDEGGKNVQSKGILNDLSRLIKNVKRNIS